MIALYRKSKNPQKLNRAWIVLTLVMIITTDLGLVELGGYPVVLTFALLPVWLSKSFVLKKTLRIKVFVFYVVLLFLPFINVGDVINWVEFTKSYALLMMNAFILLFLCYSRQPKINFRTIHTTVLIAQNLILVYSLLQLGELFYFESDYLWAIWGDWSSTFVISYWGMRAKAFYHEPSHLALISIFLFWMRYVIEGKLKRKNLLHCLTILALAKSSAGILIFPFILSYIILSKYKYFISIPIFVGLGLFLGVVISQNQTAVKKLTKFDQLESKESFSSGYMRWILPMKILNAHYESGRLLGYGLGQLERDYLREVDELFRVLNIKESAIANGLLSAQIQFGIFFTLFILYAFLFRYPKMNKDWRSFMVINFICLTAGSYFDPLFYFIRFYIPILLLASIKQEKQLLEWPKKT